MTEGHHLALDQLQAIQRAAHGSFEFASVGQEPDASGWLHITVRINCLNRMVSATGVRLKPREWLVIAIPADFPYRVPATWTRHTRFAGLPHVQWKRHLFLYQAPDTEWNVTDGMFGYITRLNIWLDHAAAGELNPTGEALHPPVAYLQDGPHRLIIPRVDTPPVVRTNWIGFGHLEKLSPTRADITQWTSLDDLEANAPLAPAFLLAEPLPYEFPKNMDELFSELQSRGVSAQLLIGALRLAVILNSESDPLFVILGTPMRGVAGSDDLKQHLAAWYVAPELVAALRSSLRRFNPDPRIREIGQEIEDIVIEWMKKTNVAWCLVREDRPEIVIRRDYSSPVAWFKDKTVSLWGCGAIGSHVGEYLIRAGVRKIVLRDKGIVTPGILARQLFTDADIGTPKVTALANRLRAITSAVEVEERRGDIVAQLLSSGDWTEGSDVVIETTGSPTLMTKLEHARRASATRSPVVSMALGHEAKNAMLLISDVGHSGGPLDVDRKLRQECYRRPELNAYTDEFWPREPRTEVFQPEPGCSDATFVGSCADVACLASVMLNLAAQELQSPTSSATAHLLTQPTSLTGSADGHTRFSWIPDQLLEEPAAGFEVRLSASAWREMGGWIAASDRTRGAAVETGGLLFGERSDLLKIIWVDEVSGPPPDSSQSATGFICGTQGTAELTTEKSKRTAGLVRFLGMWHTHPSGLPVPSSTDLRGCEQLMLSTGGVDHKAFMVIVGTDQDGNCPTAAYLFGSDDLERLRSAGATRTASIHVSCTRGATQKIAVALSGGGSRAIAFHLGCLRALQDRGVLDRIQVVSAVSGGSVIAAMYAYSQGSFSDFEQSVLTLLRRGIQTDIARELIHPFTAAKVGATFGVAGTAALAADIIRTTLSAGSGTFKLRNRRVLEAIKNIQPPLRRWSSMTSVFENVLRNRVIGDVSMTAPRRNGIEVVLNACELRSGSAFRFGSRESGCWRYGTIENNAVSVAHAVAASAAYPALLPAIDEELTFIDRKGVKRRRRVLLTDGGVYDNLGVTCLEPGQATEFGYNRYKPEYLICCDAGQGIFQDHSIPYFWGPRMVRAFESVFRKAQNATQNRLHLLASTGQISGFILAYLGQIDARVPNAPIDLVSREQVFEYPTDFAAMREEDIQRLSRRGEQLTRSLVAHYCPEL